MSNGDRTTGTDLDELSQIGPVTHFSGFSGRASKPEAIRLFFTLDFDSYIDVAKQDVVRSSTATDPKLPMPITHLWVRADAAVMHTAVDTFAGPAEFVRGQIISSCSGDIPVDLAQQIPQDLARHGLSWFSCCKTESAHPSRKVCHCCAK